jgi:hypothetical protein
MGDGTPDGTQNVSVPSRRKAKPTSVEETVRVMRIFDMLADELTHRFPPLSIYTERASESRVPWQKPTVVTTVETPIQFTGPSWDILAVADRIAARTED